MNEKKDREQERVQFTNHKHFQHKQKEYRPNGPT